MVLQRVANKKLRQAESLLGVKTLEENRSEKKRKKELKQFLGKVEEVYFEEKLKHVCLLGGKGQPKTSVLVGASTEEVVGERRLLRMQQRLFK